MSFSKALSDFVFCHIIVRCIFAVLWLAKEAFEKTVAKVRKILEQEV
jgi:hypothetical protein